MGLNSQGAEKLNLNRDVTIRKTCMPLSVTPIERRKWKDAGRFTEKAQDTRICNAFYLEGFLFS